MTICSMIRSPPSPVVLRFEVLPEDPGYSLPESGHESAAEFAQHLVGRVVRLAVDELEQHVPLGAGHVLGHGSVLLLDLVVDLLDIGFLRLFRGQFEQNALHLGHLGPGGLRHGVDALDGPYELLVAAQIDRTVEDVDRQEVDVGYRIAPLDDPLLPQEPAPALRRRLVVGRTSAASSAASSMADRFLISGKIVTFAASAPGTPEVKARPARCASAQR